MLVGPCHPASAYSFLVLWRLLARAFLANPRSSSLAETILRGPKAETPMHGNKSLLFPTFRRPILGYSPVGSSSLNEKGSDLYLIRLV